MIFFSFLLIFRDIHVPDVYLVLNYINLDFHLMIDPIQYTYIYFLLYAKSYKEEKKKVVARILALCTIDFSAASSLLNFT